jgi:hypothetical protein
VNPIDQAAIRHNHRKDGRSKSLYPLISVSIANSTIKPSGRGYSGNPIQWDMGKPEASATSMPMTQSMPRAIAKTIPYRGVIIEKKGQT